MFLNLNKVNGKTEINREFKENMFQIIKQYGNEIFEKNLLYSYMTDYFPGEKEFLMVMKATYEDGVYTKLATFYDNCGRDKKRMNNLLEEEIKRLEAKFLWSEEIAKFCIEIFENAGEDLPIEKVDDHKTEKKEKYEKCDNLWINLSKDSDEKEKHYVKTLYPNILKNKSVTVEIGEGFQLSGLKIKEGDTMSVPYVLLIEASNSKKGFSDQFYQEMQHFLAKSREMHPGMNILVLCDGELKRDRLLAETRDPKDFVELMETGRTVWFLNNVSYPYPHWEKKLWGNVLEMVACFTGGEPLQSENVRPGDMEIHGGLAADVCVERKGQLYIKFGAGEDKGVEIAIARCIERKNGHSIYDEMLDELSKINEIDNIFGWDLVEPPKNIEGSK